QVLTTSLPARGWTQLYWGGDPCDDSPQPNPCDAANGTTGGQGIEAEGERGASAGEIDDQSQQPTQPTFVEQGVPSLQDLAVLDPAMTRDAVNRHGAEL